MTKAAKEGAISIFLRMHPLTRILFGIIFAAITFFSIPKGTFSPLLHAMLVWIVFSFTFLLGSWIVLFQRPIAEIKKTATADDGSKIIVFVMVLISSFASMFTVLLLILSRETEKAGNIMALVAAICGILLSWFMVHTIFAFHYAHMYYDDDYTGQHITKGLDFPGSEEPDYIDFAYFSFVIGCTFQVSDVEISSRRIRRLAMLHGLLSFGLNTFVVALTINIIAAFT